MAGEAYQVDYIINLQDRASAGIANFSRAASKLTAAAENLKKFEGTFNQVVGQLSKPLKMSINTQNAHKSLDKVLRKIEKIKNEAGSINVGVASNNVRNRRVTNQTPAPAVAPVRTPRQQGPRPLVGSRAGQPLIPRNLEYQVLGPTRLGNVAMLDMFKGMGLMYGISAIGSGVRDILSQSTEYENIMQTAKNILKTNYKGGNFDASFIDLERIAREVGVETKFTAPEVADAVKFLAMAGLDVNAIKKSIRPIADIALIGDTDLGQTADVMTNIMTAYGIRPDDMRRTADVMTRTFTMSNTTLMELAESFKMAGSMLHLANVPFETAAAAFGVLGDAGIKATMAGTTMRTIMNNLRNPTKNQQKYWDMLGIRRFDEYGNLREINEIFADLNRLNGNDERSRTARAKYEELQKKYAPKLEGLQEGSLEYNSVIAEYDKESETIRKQFGGVDVFRLFRLTAASGAGVLMNSVEKWNQVIQENFLSEGLSQRLADEKKNTIAGMWAQLKSAFQEGGLKVFEENDGRIRGYLSRGISWLKSTEFTDMLRSVFDLVADLGKMLLWFTKNVVTLYDRFKPLIKYFLEFQLVLKGIQLIIGSGKMFGNALLYTLSPLMNAAISSPWVQRRMPGMYGLSMAATQMLVPNANNTPNGMLNGMNPLLAWWFTGRKGKGMPIKPVEIPQQNLAPYALSNKSFDPSQVSLLGPVMSQQTMANYEKQLSAYNKRVARANKIQANAGWSSIAGGIAGSYLGSAIAPDSEWAGAIGGVAGSLGSVALASMSVPGAGWIAAGVIGAAAATAAVIKHIRAINDARRAADLYIDSMKRLDVESWNIGSQKDFFVAAIRIRSSSLTSEQEKLNASIELWRKYYKAINGEEGNYEPSKGALYNENITVRNLIDGLTGKAGNAFKNELLSELTENGGFAKAEAAIKQMFSDELAAAPEMSIWDIVGMGLGGMGGGTSTMGYTGFNYDNLYNSLQSASGLLFATTALDQNNPLFDKIALWREEAEKGVGSMQDVERRMEEFRNLFMTPSGEIMSFQDQANIDLKDLKDKYSYSDWLRFPTFYALMIPQLQKELEDYQEKMTAVFSGEQNSAQNLYLPQIFGGMNTNATFGTSEFKRAYDEWLSTVPIDDVARKKMPQTSFQNLLDIFNRVSDEQKKYLLPMLNRDYWEKTLGVDLSTIQGGFYAPTESTPNPYGDMFKWNAQKGYYEYDGMPSYPSLNGETWMYKPLSMQPATEQTNTGAIDVTNTGALAGFHSATSWQDLAASLFYNSYHLNPVRPAEAEAANNNANNGTATTITAQGFPYYPADWIPENTLPPLNNEAFRPAERQQVAMVARPVVININTDRFMDVSNIDIDNQQDTETLRQTMKDVFADIVSEIAADTGGTFNLGVA